MKPSPSKIDHPAPGAPKLPAVRWIMAALIVWGLLLAFGAFPYNWLMALLGWDSRISWSLDKAMVVAVMVGLFLGLWGLALAVRRGSHRSKHQ